MRKIKVVVLLVQQLQHGFTKNAKVSPNLTVAHICVATMGTASYHPTTESVLYIIVLVILTVMRVNTDWYLIIGKCK